MKFANKTIVISGASRGIGASAAREFASQGANVVLLARSTEALETLADEIGEKALALAPDRAPCAVQSLSPREVDAMTLLAVGYSRAQVADRLSISEHTLRAYVESARFKLGASNTTHAVARALSRGLIVV